MPCLHWRGPGYGVMMVMFAAMIGWAISWDTLQANPGLTGHPVMEKAPGEPYEVEVVNGVGALTSKRLDIPAVAALPIKVSAAWYLPKRRDRQTSTRARRGRPRAEGVGGRDRDQDWPALLRTYLAPPAHAPMVLRRARPRPPSAQQPTASRV